MKITENCTLLQLLKVESEKLTNYQQSSQSSRMRQASSLEDFDFRPVIKQTFVNNAIDLDSSSSQFRGLSNGGPVTNSLVKVQYCCLLQSGKHSKAQNNDDQVLNTYGRNRKKHKNIHRKKRCRYVRTDRHSLSQ